MSDNITIQDIKNELTNMYDVRYREIQCAHTIIHIVYIESMCNKDNISDYIIRPLMNHFNPRDNLDKITAEIIQASSAKQVKNVDDAVSHVITGNVVVLFTNVNQAITCTMNGFEKRAIDIPQTETVIKGPREGFTEDINDNISAIRRKVKTTDLKIEHFFLGRQTQTSTVMIFIEGIAPEKLVRFVRQKIAGMQNEYVIYSNYLESKLRCKLTPFDTIGYTEKPDVAVSKLAEGRVVVIVDGSPFVVTAPYFFIENFQTTDDYTLNPFTANIGRSFRWVAFLLSTFIPGIYLALITYHYKLIPTVLLYRLALFRAGVPVPTIIELLYMILFFQIIREAGVRLPQPIGPTLSIVGALILGESAVASGLSSQFTVVVVAITSIASYLIPVLYSAIFFWSIIIVLLSGMIGLPGFYMGGVLFLAHLCGLTTCGYPYLFPLGTLKTFQYKDVLMRGNLDSISNTSLPKGKQK